MPLQIISLTYSGQARISIVQMAAAPKHQHFIVSIWQLQYSTAPLLPGIVQRQDTDEQEGTPLTRAMPVPATSTFWPMTVPRCMLAQKVWSARHSLGVSVGISSLLQQCRDQSIDSLCAGHALSCSAQGRRTVVHYEW